MKHIRISPLAEGRRPIVAAKDPRWALLDLVRQCRGELGLRDRDVTVLRGLLSLVPEGARELTVYASNRVLIERCDGIEERTLRRRIAALVAAGLIGRRQSPNGKRYQLRDGAEAVLTYGLDLRPLFEMAPHLEALAEASAAAALRVRALRALIRDWLYHHGTTDPRHEEARLALRRKMDCEGLALILADLRAEAPDLSASDSQNVRHIQNSDKDSLESEEATKKADITVAECLELASTAAELSPAPVRDWADIQDLSASLAPAIGIGRACLDRARAALGRHGAALAVLGLLQAFGRIRNPEAYLTRLARKAKEGGLDMVRMFRSLARPALA